MGLQLIKRQREVLPKTRVMKTSDPLRQALKSVLPFRPSRAQKRVLREIVDDLCSTKVMSRLLHGDVGSGKTIVALQAIVVGIENGHQAALMAPTEILAEQHFRTFTSYLENTSYEVALLTSRVKGKKRKAILARIESGDVDLVIGTHALIEQQVEFKDLALVVIDEQHRFRSPTEVPAHGQRRAHPDTLVMTATPIPRSLALTVFGDLDLSVLDEMPPGRQPVRTVIKSERSRQEIYEVIRERAEETSAGLHRLPADRGVAEVGVASCQGHGRASAAGGVSGIHGRTHSWAAQGGREGRIDEWTAGRAESRS